MQINGSHLGTAEWLLSLELQRCMRLDGLMLIDCQFGAMDVTTLCMLPMLSYAAFCHCSNLSNEQVAAFVNACPVLTQLYLIGCPQLTIQLLYSLFNMRCIEQLGTPALGLYLPEGEPLLEEFKLNFSKQQTLELLETPLEDSHVQHVQFIFLQPESRQQ